MGNRQTRRWRPRFSLRGLLIVTTAVAVWLGVYLGRSRNERLAAEAIAAAGGWVVYDWQAEGLSQPRQPAWLRRVLGRHFFDRIVEVRLDLCDLHDADYQALGRLNRLEKLLLRPEKLITAQNAAEIASIDSLRELDLSHMLITAPALTEIAKLPRLEKLTVMSRFSFMALPSTEEEVDRYRPDDAGARAIASCKSLRELILWNAVISDEGAAALCNLQNLEALSIGSPNVTGKTLREVKRLDKLTKLRAWWWRIDEEDLAALGDAPNLIDLELYASPELSDSSLPYLAELTQLEELHLGPSNQVTDAGLRRLHGMTNLKQLDLSRSRVDKLGEAAKRLQDALPDCAIRLPKTAAEIEKEARERENRFLRRKWGP